MRSIAFAGLFSCLALVGCATSSTYKTEGTVADFALVLCNAEDNSLIVYNRMGGKPFTREDHPICARPDLQYKDGEIAGYLTSGAYFSKLKGRFGIVCSAGFIALTGDFRSVPACLSDPTIEI